MPNVSYLPQQGANVYDILKCETLVLKDAVTLGGAFKAGTRREKAVVVSKIQAYGHIISPVVTEKSTLGSEHNPVTFKVKMDATKPQIKLAVEQIFDVKVKAVAR